MAKKAPITLESLAHQAQADKQKLAQVVTDVVSLTERVGAVMAAIDDLKAAVQGLQDQVTAAVAKLDEHGTNDVAIGDVTQQVLTMHDDLQTALGGGGNGGGGEPPPPPPPPPAAPMAASPTMTPAQQRIREMQLASQRPKTPTPPAAG